MAGIYFDIPFWHSFWHLFWHSLWHSFWHSIWHLFSHSFWHSIWNSLCHLAEVQQCPLRSGVRGWDPQYPLNSCSSRFRSGSAHWALELAVEGPAARTEIWHPQLRSAARTEIWMVEVRQYPLRSIWGLRLRSRSAHWHLELVGEVQRCPLRFGVHGWGPVDAWQCPVTSGARRWGPAVRKEGRKQGSKESRESREGGREEGCIFNLW